MPSIRLLSDHLVSQIAAGEVVERPASVVKELVENSLDAGATAIEIDLEAGGKRRITISDDGSGMGPDDALLAFDRHATSKIESFEDLERVGTLGFRGEALASIAAVARVELLTAEAPGEGHRVKIEGGRVRVAEPAARPRGTTLEIASLFFNVPARRKFLKSPATELRRCLEVVQGYALARPDVRFTVRHGGRTLLDALPAPATPEGVRQRIRALFGEELAEELAVIPWGETEGGTGFGPAEVGEEGADGGEAAAGEAGAGRAGVGDGARREAIWGLVGSPATTRGRRLFTFVNRRLLRDRAMLAVFYRSVREVWKGEDFPALFLFLDLPPEEVDVNVHPQKAEVRFRDPRLLDRLAAALRAGLDEARGEEAAPLRAPEGPPPMPFAWQGLGGRGDAEGQPGPSGWGRDDRPYDLPAGTASELAEGVGSAEGSPGAGAPGGLRFSGNPGPGGFSSWGRGGQGPGWDRGDRPPGPEAARLATAAYAPLPDRPRVPLSGRSGPARPFRLLGQYKGTLILLEGPDGLYLIDQHVAHERLLYERLRRSLRKEAAASQSLLTPPLLELAAPERMRLLELAPALEERGFGVLEMSGGDVALTSVPAVLSADEAERLLLELAAGDGEGEGDAEDLERRILDSLAASLSCKGAVKMHHPLTPEEMETLVAELFAAENPYACPHGRPVVLKMGDADLERRFGRR